MEGFPSEENFESIDISELDLDTLHAIRERISLVASGMAVEIMLSDTSTEPLPAAIQDPQILNYIAERERRIRAESNLQRAGSIKELAMEIDELIAKKENI